MITLRRTTTLLSTLLLSLLALPSLAVAHEGTTPAVLTGDAQTYMITDSSGLPPELNEQLRTEAPLVVTADVTSATDQIMDVDTPEDALPQRTFTLNVLTVERGQLSPGAIKVVAQGEVNILQVGTRVRVYLIRQNGVLTVSAAPQLLAVTGATGLAPMPLEGSTPDPLIDTSIDPEQPEEKPSIPATVDGDPLDLNRQASSAGLRAGGGKPVLWVASVAGRKRWVHFRDARRLVLADYSSLSGDVWRARNVAADWNNRTRLGVRYQRRGRGNIAVYSVNKPHAPWAGLAVMFPDRNGYSIKARVYLNSAYDNAYINAKGLMPWDMWRRSVACQEVGHTLGLGHGGGDCMASGYFRIWSNRPEAANINLLHRAYSYRS